jgi:putative MFS transporter
MSRSGIKTGNTSGRPSKRLRQNSGDFDARVSRAPEKLTANQWKIIATANVGDMLDFFDFFLIGYVLAFILKEWQLTYGQSALILISAGVGAVLGGFFWGWMGDRIGRRKVFILTALNVAFATGMMFFTPGPDG